MTGDALGLRLGVIGGLGPLASADFYRKLTELTRPAPTPTTCRSCFSAFRSCPIGRRRS